MTGADQSARVKNKNMTNNHQPTQQKKYSAIYTDQFLQVSLTKKSKITKSLNSLFKFYERRK